MPNSLSENRHRAPILPREDDECHSLIDERKDRDRDLLVELSPDLLCIADKEGAFWRMHPHFQSVVGFNEEDLFEKPLLNFVHPEDRSKTSAVVESLFKGQSIVCFENRCHCKDGSYRWLSWTSSHSDPEQARIYLVARDITDQKRDRELLQESQRVAKLGSWEYLVENKCLRWSDETYRIHDVAPGTPVELEEALNFYLSPDRERIREAFVQACGHGEAFDLEARLQPRKSDQIWVRTRGVAEKLDHKIIRVFGVIQDITERKTVEEAQQKLSQLQAVGQLAGGLAHDFNNYLASILLNISSIQLDSNLSADTRESLGETSRVVAAAQQLTRQLLTFSKGGKPLIQTFHLADLLKDAAEFTLRGSSISSSWNLAPDLWTVEADQGQIQQVISNIVLNARQAMNHCGYLKISASNEKISANSCLGLAAGNYVAIRLKDSGPGINPDIKMRIFEPYFTTKPEGSGLGLASAYSIISHHRGAIACDSDPGEGSTFTVYLPASDRPEPAPASPKPKAATGTGLIIVMDDDENIRRSLSTALRLLKHPTVMASRGEECIEEFKKLKAEGRPVQAIILDLTIPGGMGGLETLEELLKIDPSVITIASSGYSEGGALANYKEYGFKDVLPKPFSIDQLRETIGRFPAS